MRAARRQNKWTSSSFPFYFVCSIFKKALYSLSPNTDSVWSIILQLYSSSTSVTLWGDQVCGVGQKYVGIDVSEHFSNSVAFLLAPNHVTLVQHIWIEQCNEPLEHIAPDCASIINLKKARKWKGLEHNPLVNLMSPFTITCRREHLGTRYYRGIEYIGMDAWSRDYIRVHIFHMVIKSTRKSLMVSQYFSGPCYANWMRALVIMTTTNWINVSHGLDQS